MIFINLPVADLAASVRFYERLGATLNREFTDDTAAMVVFSETIHVMLLTHDKFRQFTTRAIAGRDTVQTLLCLSAGSREEVDEMVADAVSGGGAGDPGPVQDYGMMYGRSFEDLDGHIWEIMWMDLEAFRAARAAQPVEA
jgi:predicted lactoylglutathione lyase